MVLDGLVGTATVTTQGPHRRLRHDTKGGDLYLATSGDLDMATSGDFYGHGQITPGNEPVGTVTTGPSDHHGVTRWGHCRPQRRVSSVGPDVPRQSDRGTTDKKRTAILGGHSERRDITFSSCWP